MDCRAMSMVSVGSSWMELIKTANRLKRGNMRFTSMELLLSVEAISRNSVGYIL